MTEAIKRMFGDGYRIFFLAAGLYGLFAVMVWESWLGVHALGGMVTSTPYAPPPHLWHAHEMIFGYATAALGGFFLTAVPNWTGARAARHQFITAVAGLWLAGRIAVWFSAGVPPVLVAVLDLAFLPVLAAKIATQLIKRPKPQNMMFLALLTIIWLGNLMVHLEWTGVIADGAAPGMRVGLLGICAMIAVLGGRVTPAFTRNAMTRDGIETNLPRSHRPFEIAGIAAAILLPVLVLARAPEAALGGVALVAGLAQLARLAGWRTSWTLSNPILWSLHLGFGLLALGYLTLGLSAFGIGSEVAALHVLGIGAVGGMTIAVMSRAILGHSGRPLVAPVPVTVAYLCVLAAVILRWLASTIAIDWYFFGMLAAGAAWCLAMLLFVAALWHELTGPKPNPG